MQQSKAKGLYRYIFTKQKVEILNKNVRLSVDQLLQWNFESAWVYYVKSRFVLDSINKHPIYTKLLVYTFTYNWFTELSKGSIKKGVLYNFSHLVLSFPVVWSFCVCLCGSVCSLTR